MDKDGRRRFRIDSRPGWAANWGVYQKRTWWFGWKLVQGFETYEAALALGVKLRRMKLPAEL